MAAKLKTKKSKKIKLKAKSKKKTIKVAKPKIKILKSISVDPAKYKEGYVRRSGGSSRGLCDCEYCQELLLAVNGKSNVDSKAVAVFNTFAAKAARVRMSIEVSKPGFFALKGLKKKTGDQFDHVFFPEAGRYSLVSIYKHCRDRGGNFANGPLTSRLKRKLNEEQIQEFSAVFGSVIPLGASSCTKLEREVTSWKDVESEIYSLIKADKEEAPTYDGVFVVFDRFIPMVYANGTVYQILEDGTPKKGGLIPGLKSDDDTKSKSYIANQFKELCNAVAGGNTSVLFAGFDIVENKLSYALDIAEVIHGAIKENLDKYNGVSNIATLVEALPGPKTFLDKLNENFVSMGAIGFSAESVFPADYTTSFSTFDFETRDGESKSANEKCYFVNLNYNGKPSIGVSGGGFIYVRTNEELSEFILVQSTWCQRISSWSKNVEGVVDQHYNIWPIADWLSGPWSEKKGYAKEQMVFSGNKNRTTKTDVLADLRKRLRAKLA
jgi:hypothetical protein